MLASLKQTESVERRGFIDGTSTRRDKAERDARRRDKMRNTKLAVSQFVIDDVKLIHTSVDNGDRNATSHSGSLARISERAKSGQWS